MKYQVIFTEPAATTIEENAVWWARERSADQASRWYDGIRAAILSLDEFPQRCPLAPENDRFPYELRDLYFGLGSRPTHRIIFTIVTHHVVVLAVRHGAQRDLRHGDLKLP
jgi:plasmid stabilization system protein ParE